jgi:hypothetical protein
MLDEENYSNNPFLLYSPFSLPVQATVAELKPLTLGWWGECPTTGRHDTQHNDTQHNDTQHDDTHRTKGL